MGNSFCALYEHLVFGTKHREPWLTEHVRARLHAYLGGVVKSRGGTALAVGGVEDHVHLLILRHQDMATSALVRELKRGSTNWMRAEGLVDRTFCWQRGGGYFSVSAWDVEKVRGYVRDQVEHHRRTPWQEEFRKLLRRHGVVFDEDHLFD